MAAAKSNNASPPGTGRLWASWFVAVAAWGVHLFASYGLVEWHCNNPGALQALTLKLQLHGLTLVCFGLAAFGTWLGWDGLRKLRNGVDRLSTARSRFIVVSGIMLSAFLAVVVLVQGIPNFIFEPCL